MSTSDPGGRPMGPKGATFAMFKAAIERNIPFNRLLGLQVLESSQKGLAAIRMPANPDLIGDARRPALHGGSLAALIDATAGFAAWTQLPDIHARLSTADLRIDYLRPAPVDVDMVCEARVQLAGRRLIWVDAVVFPEGRRDDVVAMGRGTFAVKAAAPSGAAADGDAETSESA